MIAAPENPGRNRGAAALMLGAVCCFSLWPLVVDLGGGSASPFLFNAGFCLGVGLGWLVYLVVAGGRVLRRPGAWSEVRGRAFRFCRQPGSLNSWAVALMAVSYFDFALFSWATRYVAVAVAAMLFELWPLFLVFIMARLFRQEDRYRRVTPATALLLLLGFAGFVLVALAQLGGWPAGAESAARPAWGVGLSLTAALATSLTAFAFRWGTDLSGALSSVEHGPASVRATELTGVGLVILMADAVALPVNVAIGLLFGEMVSVRLLVYALIGGGVVYSVGSLCWRLANLLTSNLAINALNYATPALSLVWLFVFAEVHTPRVDYLVAGAALIVLANCLVGVENWQHGRQVN